MNNLITIYGAGALGRGYLAPLFYNLGYDINFVDINNDLISQLKKQKCYTSAVTLDNHYGFRKVILRASYLLGEEGDAVRDSSIVFVCVGPRNSLKLWPRLKNAKVVITCENDRKSAKNLRNHTELQTIYFGIADVIASNTASPELLKENPLCVVTEKGDLILEKGDYELPPEITQVDEKTIEMHWNCKSFLHNTPHAIVGYLGWQKHYTYIHEAIADDEINKIVINALEEIKKGIIHSNLVKSDVVEEYALKELRRFKNRLLFDPITRVTREPFRKLADEERLISAAKIAFSAGVTPINICNGIKATLRYDNPYDKDCLERRTMGMSDVDVLKKYCQLDGSNPLFHLIMQANA